MSMRPYVYEVCGMTVDIEWFEDTWSEYLAYLKDWVETHGDVGCFGASPKGFSEWRGSFYGK